MIAYIPAKLKPLYEPHRYKVAYSGRGSGKSWGFADALLFQGTQKPLRVLCTRETQDSIQESVHALLSARIHHHNLERFYDVQQARIHSRVFTTPVDGKDTSDSRPGFSFSGLFHNAAHIKSYEGYDIAWVEEAQGVSKESWEILIPTIRKEGSEMWVSFNPNLETDDTYRRFVLNPPREAVIMRLSWRDNPFFPEVLKREMEELRQVDPDACDHVYEGHPRSTVIGAIYAEEIKRAEKERRITSVPYDATRPVDTFWDIGYGDMTSIWFAQSVQLQYRVIDYYQNRMKALDHYLQILQGRGYTYGTSNLPWDGGAKQLGTGKSIEELMRAKGFRVRVLKQWGVSDGINAARTIFNRCWFDGERCLEGLQGLRRYQWGETNSKGVAPRVPLHDDASHPADAFRTLAVSITEPEQPKVQVGWEPPKVATGSWMGRI